MFKRLIYCAGILIVISATVLCCLLTSQIAASSPSVYDYVDNNVSDVDFSPDKGTHSNFTAQQAGPDSQYDILTEENTAGNWWNISYRCRRQLNITTVSALPSGYSVSFTMDTTGTKFQDHGDDLRVVYWNGTKFIELDRINETAFNTADTEIWFKTQKAISENGFDDNYYVYYDFPGAVNPPSNRSNVYAFWDDFDDGDANGWTVTQGIWAVENDSSAPSLPYVYSTVGNITAVSVAGKSVWDNYVIEAKLKFVEGTYDINIIARYESEGNLYEYEINVNGDRLCKRTCGSFTELASTTEAHNVNQWYTLKMVVEGTSIKTYLNGVLHQEVTDTDHLTGKIGLRSYCNAHMHGDDVKVRLYVSPEPVVSLSPEISLNYELDLEVQWTNARYDQTYEELCIYGGTMGSENIRVDVWTGSAWQNLFTDLTSGWNNVSVTDYLVASNFTIRFKGGMETGDTVQDSWQIDCTLLHTWGIPPVAPVAQFSYTPEYPLTLDTITFNASASYDPDGTIVNYTWNFGDLNITTVTDPIITHTYTTNGTYTVTLNVTDSDDLWNTTTTILTVDRRDAAVISVVPAKNQTYPSWIPPLNITVTVLNNGTEPANFTVTAYYDTNVIGAPQNVTNLGAGEQLNLTFSWNLTAVAYGLYDIKAVATLEDDVNPANNEFVVYDAVKVKIPGDVDGNGVVDGGDLGTLGWAWGTSPGMPKYDPQCDFDQDGSIGGGDLGLLGWNWGESVTY